MSTTWKSLSGAFSEDIAATLPFSVVAGTLALDSAYTYASAGDAAFFTFIPRASANLTEFQLKVSSYTGTWANTDGVIDVEIREGLANTGIPGTTLTGSFTITLDGSTTGWIHKTGVSIALVAGRMYSVVIADADGGASDFVTLTYKYGTLVNSVISDRVYTTTNGYSTAGTSNGVAIAMAWQVGDDWYGGSGYDTAAVVASGTYERGIRFRVKENCTLVGIECLNAPTVLINTATSTSKWNLYADATAPLGTALMSYEPPSTTYTGTQPAVGKLQFPTASHYDLEKDTWYRLVLEPNPALTVPRKVTINGSPDADLLIAMMPFLGDCHWTEDTAGSWVDDTASTPHMSAILVPTTAVAGGGQQSYTFGG